MEVSQLLIDSEENMMMRGMDGWKIFGTLHALGEI
jgi:hypothetical protein